jgi:predicted Na+-dependent transporter
MTGEVILNQVVTDEEFQIEQHIVGDNPASLARKYCTETSCFEKEEGLRVSEAEESPPTPTPPSILLRVSTFPRPQSGEQSSPSKVTFRSISQRSSSVESPPSTPTKQSSYKSSACSASPCGSSLSLGHDIIKPLSESSLSPSALVVSKPVAVRSPGCSKSMGNLSFHAFRRNSSAIFIEWIDERSKRPKESSLCQKFSRRLGDYYRKNEVFTLSILSIVLAKVYPRLGAIYLCPHITSTWLAVIYIFGTPVSCCNMTCYCSFLEYFFSGTHLYTSRSFVSASFVYLHTVLAGLGLRTEKFSRAMQRFKFNAVVQIFSFGVVPVFVFGTTRTLIHMGAIDKSLADGMAICACLPMTISSVAVLTKVSGGDESAAVFNSAFSNVLSVFLSPALIFTFLGVKGDVNIADVFYKLALRVVVPFMVGQILQKKSKWAIEFLEAHQEFFRRSQLGAVMWIVYTVFCVTFQAGSTTTTLLDIFTMVLTQLLFLMTIMIISWTFLTLVFPQDPRLVVMGFFGCHQKTVSPNSKCVGHDVLW